MWRVGTLGAVLAVQLSLQDGGEPYEVAGLGTRGSALVRPRLWGDIIGAPELAPRSPIRTAIGS